MAIRSFGASGGQHIEPSNSDAPAVDVTIRPDLSDFEGTLAHALPKRKEQEARLAPSNQVYISILFVTGITR
jgi:hypothetical protein